MKLGFHGATTMTSTLETDVEITAAAGFKGLEVWAAKVDTYLATHSVEDLRDLFVNNAVLPLAINSIEFIGFRGSEYPLIQKRCAELSRWLKPSAAPRSRLSPAPRLTVPFSGRRLWMNMSRSCATWVPLLAEYNIRLAFEFLGFGWCSVRTPRGAC